MSLTMKFISLLPKVDSQPNQHEVRMTNLTPQSKRAVSEIKAEAEKVQKPQQDTFEMADDLSKKFQNKFSV
ncbi:MAG: hypothetical protein Q7S68_03155 [Deltaproteobacteria bacterium]|nr:hypothetical protein [Deltaproteobacteria bacterium]